MDEHNREHDLYKVYKYVYKYVYLLLSYLQKWLSIILQYSKKTFFMVG